MEPKKNTEKNDYKIPSQGISIKDEQPLSESDHDDLNRDL